MINCSKVSLGDEVIWRFVPDISFWFWLFARMPTRDLPVWPGFSQNTVTTFHGQTPERVRSQQKSYCHYLTQPQKLCSITCFVRQSVRPFEVPPSFLENGEVLERNMKSDILLWWILEKYQSLREENGILLYYGGSINW